MKPITRYEITETKSTYTLTKESAKLYFEKWGRVPVLKKIVWGVEIKKPLYFELIDGYIDEAGIQHQINFGWVFEENGRMIPDFKSKDLSKKYAK